MKSELSMPGGAKKLAFHHTEIHPAENGGLTVKHVMKPGDGDYGPPQEKNFAFGPDDHAAAMKEAHSECCDSASCMSGVAPAKKSMSPKTNDRAEMSKVKQAVSSKLGSFGKKA